MAVKNYTLEDVMAEIQRGSYNYYGFRKATEHDMEVIERGYLDCSFDSFEGSESEELLSGTSAVAVYEHMSEAEVKERYEYCKKMYSGSKILLIADSRSEYGSDENEIILGHDGYGADVIAEIHI